MSYVEDYLQGNFQNAAFSNTMAFSMIFCNPCDPFAKTQAKKNNTVAAHLSQIVALESHVFMIFLVALSVTVEKSVRGLRNSNRGRSGN